MGWLCATIATTAYVLTMEPTTSFWDTGEFIAAACHLQIVHQPGAPLFLMLQNLFSNLAMGNPEGIAYWMNFGSALSSGLTILFLFWTITALARKVVLKRGVRPTSLQLMSIMGAGGVGALAYAFSDSFWFSAVESEVYAMSSLCTAVVFWAILKWEAHADEDGADRWLVLIAFIMGLSIGVHLLNLLTIPALALVIYYRRARKVTASGVMKALAAGCLVLAFILWGVIQYLIKFAAYSDLFFVNILGLGFGTGTVFFALLVIGGLGAGLWYSVRRAKPILNIALLCVSFVIFGYSSFSMVLIRANANPALNNTQPDNVFSFLGYLDREQFGKEPLLRGPYFDSKVIAIEEGTMKYRKGKGRYEEIGRTYERVYDRTTLFPRVYSDRDYHPEMYRDWLGLSESESPQFADNMSFFNTYQLGHMYARYFMWNFAGRQNDQEGHGSYTEGNWISGIKPVDEMRLGGQYTLPKAMESDPSRNAFYFLPLILGIIGLAWHVKRHKKDALIVGLLFFFTGIAIVLYLNMSPLQPRERDYAFSGSFYAFAIWIGLGVLGLAELMRQRLAMKTSAILAIGLGLLMAPSIMGIAGWDDHDRSQKYMARDMALNYLESCAPNAILFTYVDNETYPLWYLQQVEGVRTDVRVVNLNLLGMDWQVRQLQKPVNQADALPISMVEHQYVNGVRDVLWYQDANIVDSIELKDILAILLSDNPNDKIAYTNGARENFLPTKHFKMSINKAEIVSNQVVPAAWHDQIVDTMEWTYDKNLVTRSELALIDILVHNHWKRPIYFTIGVPANQHLGLNDYLVSEGFALRLMPVKHMRSEERTEPLMNTDVVYSNLMDRYQWGNMKNLKHMEPTAYGMLTRSLKLISDTAENLITDGRIADARRMLNHTLQQMPEDIRRVDVALHYSLITDKLYRVGEIEQANNLLSRNVDFLDEHLAYYLDIAQTKPNMEGYAIRNSLVALQELAIAANRSGQAMEEERAVELFQRYKSVFYGG